LRNSTQIPVHWKLSGLDMLGEDFTVAADSGIVEPKSEYALNAYFRAMKPVNSMKKMIRLEVRLIKQQSYLVRLIYFTRFYSCNIQEHPYHDSFQYNIKESTLA
jgi:hypothetical protein